MSKQKQKQGLSLDQQIQQLVRQERYPEAEQLVRDAVDRRGDAPAPPGEQEFANSHTLGWIQQQQGRNAEALLSYQVAIEGSPNDFYATNNYCDLLLQVEADTQRVETACRRAVDAAPDHGQSHFLMAQYYRNVHNYEAAEKHLLTALELDIKDGSFPEGHPAAHRLLSLNMEQLGRLDEAHHHATLATKVGADDFDSWAALGVVATKQGNWDEAVDSLRRALAMLRLDSDAGDPAEERHLTNRLRQALQWAGRQAEAEEEYDAAVAKGWWKHPLQRPHPNYLPSITSAPWFTGEEYTILGVVVGKLEQSSAAIQAEFTRWSASQPDDSVPQPEFLHERGRGDWKVWHVSGKRPLGAFSECLVDKWPVTCRVIGELQEAGVGLRTAQFSDLGPGVQIRPHCGATNDRLVVHLGVQVEEPLLACVQTCEQTCLYRRVYRRVCSGRI